MGASYYREAGDFLGMLECMELAAFLLSSAPSTALLDPSEAQALSLLEEFQRTELESMHAVLASSELAFSASIADMSGVYACCRAAEFRQRRQLLELLSNLRPSSHWTLAREWETLRNDGESRFQASAIFVAWIHQRFALHYLTRNTDDRFVSSPANNERIWPYTLRLVGQGPNPLIRRSRLAGWRADSLEVEAVGATLLVVPSLRNSGVMVDALAASRLERSGPFFLRPPLNKGVFVTELMFEEC
jgi:hypothetical protein